MLMVVFLMSANWLSLSSHRDLLAYHQKVRSECHIVTVNSRLSRLLVPTLNVRSWWHDHPMRYSDFAIFCPCHWVFIKKEREQCSGGGRSTSSKGNTTVTRTSIMLVTSIDWCVLDAVKGGGDSIASSLVGWLLELRHETRSVFEDND